VSLRRNPIVWLALFVALCGTSYAATQGSRRSSRRLGNAGLTQAHTLPDDQLLAGPVLVDHRAVWVEAGHRLLVRSLDASGRTRTIFSTSATPGAPKDIVWPFRVDSLAAGNGRVAFVEDIIACGSAPPRPRCGVPGAYGGLEPLVDSETLFAGRPGAIRPVESLVQPARHRCSQQPDAVVVAAAGLVVQEDPAFPCPHGVGHLVLRTFSGRLVRVLARGWGNGSPLVAAGRWAAFIRHASVVGELDHLQILRVTTGRVVLQLSRGPSPPLGFDAVALDPSGRFAVMTGGSTPRPCQGGNFDQLSVGQIGHPSLQVLTTEVGDLATIGGNRVAYLQPTGRCLTGERVVIAAPGATPIPVPGLKVGTSMAFDGRMVATAGTPYPKLTNGARPDTVQLTRAPAKGV
jgi:hypothetical protein